MGGMLSKRDEVQEYLSQEELEDLKIGSCFTRDEIQRLYNRFRNVDADDNRTLSLEEFMNFPGAAHQAREHFSIAESSRFFRAVFCS
eukprot:SAG11_NODE_1389_length_5057_cov_16.280355_5_plen_87_part_00